MTLAVLTFLGRVPKSEHGYRLTRYDFGRGDVTDPLAFFGWELQDRLKAERLVVMGTAGSMWDHLFEGDVALGGAGEEARIALLEATEQHAVTREHLEPLEVVLAERRGCEVSLEVIPYCRDEVEQVELLRIMAAHVGPGDHVHLDVTHGFRHLPMIALLAALYLKTQRKATIPGIWYGAYDPDSGDAPVHNLAGLLRIGDWLQALHTYDKDGDYGVFAGLLGSSADLLARGAFFERTSNPVKAREALTGWASRADRFPSGDPAAELFREELDQRVSWYRGANRIAWERDLAFQYLEKGDYVRCVIYGMEAVVTSKVDRQGKDTGSFDHRDAAREELKSSLKGFKMLNHLRNALAHGVRPFDSRIEEAISDPEKLRNTLKSLLTKLLRSRVAP